MYQLIWKLFLPRQIGSYHQQNIVVVMTVIPNQDDPRLNPMGSQFLTPVL